jgi:hypothetical protein
LGLIESALRIWVAQVKTERSEGKPGTLATTEREELRWLRKRVREFKVTQHKSKWNTAATWTLVAPRTTILLI